MCECACVCCCYVVVFVVCFVFGPVSVVAMSFLWSHGFVLVRVLNLRPAVWLQCAFFATAVLLRVRCVC